MAELQEDQQNVMTVEVLLPCRARRRSMTIPRNADLLKALQQQEEDSSIQPSTFYTRYQYNGRWIVPGETPAGRNMHDHDIIESRVYDPSADAVDELLRLRMVSKTGPHAEFRYRRHAPLRRALVEYAKKRGLDVAQLRFWYDCQIVSVDDTPHMLQMQQNSKILVCDSFDAVQVRLLLWDGGASSYADQKVFVGNKRDVVSNLMRNYAQCMSVIPRKVEYRFRDRNLRPMTRLGELDDNMDMYHIKTTIF